MINIIHISVSYSCHCDTRSYFVHVLIWSSCEYSSLLTLSNCYLWSMGAYLSSSRPGMNTSFSKHMYTVHYCSDPILLGQHLTLERLSQFSSRLSQASSRVNYSTLLLIYSQNKCLSLANFDIIGKIIPWS